MKQFSPKQFGMKHFRLQQFSTIVEAVAAIVVKTTNHVVTAISSVDYVSYHHTISAFFTTTLRSYLQVSTVKNVIAVVHTGISKIAKFRTTLYDVAKHIVTKFTR